MKTIALCVALAIGLGAQVASAASLGLTTNPAPIITGSGTAVNRDLGAWTLVVDGSAAEVPAQVPPVSLTLTAFGDITTLQTASLFVYDDLSSLVLGGDLVNVGFVVDPLGDDTLELLFGSLVGSGTGSFGPQVLLTVTGELGDDPINTGFGSFFSPVAVQFTLATVTTSQVPLPAGLPTLGAALITLAGVSRWVGRKAAA